MNAFLPLHILQHKFLLLAEKALLLEDFSTLVLSDVHFGKSGHFRKFGIAIPQKVIQHDLFRLLHLIQLYKVNEVIIVGDFFHSNHNSEHNLVSKFLQDAQHVLFTLVKGNHDILHNNWYVENGIQTIEGVYTKHGIDFVHDAADKNTASNNFVISGHIHPTITIEGKGKQSIKLPCFCVQKNEMILPAFGKFTGGYAIKKTKTNSVFAITNNAIIEL
jgi:uncharacterized protein